LRNKYSAIYDNGINIAVKIPIDNPTYFGFEKTSFSASLCSKLLKILL